MAGASKEGECASNGGTTSEVAARMLPGGSGADEDFRRRIFNSNLVVE
jgi:hypothetical protein